MPNVAVWAGHRLGGHRLECPCGAPLPTEKKQCIMELKMANRKNTLNPKQVSIAIPMSISVVAFSRIVICG